MNAISFNPKLIGRRFARCHLPSSRLKKCFGNLRALSALEQPDATAVFPNDLRSRFVTSSIIVGDGQRVAGFRHSHQPLACIEWTTLTEFAMTARYATFCSDPLNPKAAEPDFADEVEAARDAGFMPVLLDHDALDHRVDPSDALRKTRTPEPGLAIYRGWMLKSGAYNALTEALSARGVELLTSPESYEACHHAPGSYEALSAFMPRTVWVAEANLDDPKAIASALACFGDSGVIIKDWVKSQAAGYWKEACFIPRAANTDQASRVIARFRELQGDGLVGGVVFKTYVPLIPVGAPADEYRAFVVGGHTVGCWPRSEGAGNGAAPPTELVARVAAKIPSPFASADFGVDQTGRWWLLEVGDGQVSGLPAEAAAKPIFEALAQTATQRE